MLSLRGEKATRAEDVAAADHGSRLLVSLQQWRLMPYLAAAYALDFFTKSVFMNFVEFQMGQMMKDKSDRQVSGHAARLDVRQRSLMDQRLTHGLCLEKPSSFKCQTLLVSSTGRVGSGDPRHHQFL